MKKEVLLNFIFTLVTSILGFLQNKYFVQYMGMETLGMMKLFTQLLSYLNIIEMGLGSASAFALYKPLADKNYNKLSIIVSTIENTYNKIAFFLLILGFFCIPLLPFIMKIENFSNKIYFYWILYVLNTASTYLFIKYIILFTANQEIIYVRFVQSSCITFFKILQIFCIVKFSSFFAYIVLLFFDNLIQWVFFKFHYRKKYFYITKTKERFDGIKNDIKSLIWHKLGILICFNTDLILISKFTSLEIVGIYASYQIIIQLMNTLLNIITSILSPKIGKFIAQNNKDSIYIYFKKINIFYYFFVIIIVECVYILISDFMKLWITNINILNNFTLKLICCNLIINLTRWNLETFKVGTGFFDDIKSPILESIINLIISIVLGLKIGLDGIIIGTIISNVVVVLIYKPILVFKRCFNKSIKDYIKIYGNYLILIIISIFSCNYILNFIPLKEVISWFDWIINGIIVGSISLIIIFVIFLSNKDFRDNLKYLKR